MSSGEAARALGITLPTLKLRVLTGAMRGRTIASMLFVERAEVARMRPIEDARRQREADRRAELAARERSHPRRASRVSDRTTTTSGATS